MRDEIAAAVVFITRMVKRNADVPKDKVDEFSEHLSALLVEKFKNHWYKDNPLKGQAYRCIRVNETEPVDPVLEKAVKDCGLKYQDLQLPPEFTLWVDPQEVCCRFGEAKGSYCTLASFKNGSMDVKAHNINLESILQKAREKKVEEDRKLTGGTHRCKPTHPQHHRHISSRHRNVVPMVNYYNKYMGHYTVNSRLFMPRMGPVLNPYHAGIKYRWVRGVDLVKV